MELPGFFRHHLNKGKPQQASVSTQPSSTKESLIKLRVKHRQEELAKRTLVKLYTDRESTLVDLAMDTHKGKLGRDVDSRRFAYGMGNYLNQRTGDVLKTFETQVLSSVDGQQRRHDLHVEALNSARTYWEETLAKPDNPPDLIMFGRRRVTQINQRLEGLTPNSNQPNRP